MQPLIDTVRDVAALAALRDPRFPPVTPLEVSNLEYEISVLSPLQRLHDVKEIRVGQHGLMLKNGQNEGVLLPQVPVEEGWDRKTFLEETARKAGLPANAWKDVNADIFEFTALVFGATRLDAVVPGATLSRRPAMRASAAAAKVRAKSTRWSSKTPEPELVGTVDADQHRTRHAPTRSMA